MMGRQSTPKKDIPPGPLPLELSLQRISINRQGYDKGGAYWGVGMPLFLAQTRSGDVELYFRASDREKAKEAVVGLVPHAKFMRR